MPVKKGDKVKVEYVGTLEDGKVFDSTEKHGQPLEFEVGSGQIIKGFDEAMIGMEKGQSKDIKLPPTEAYGDHNPQMLKKVPKDQLPKDQEIKAGTVLLVQLPNGMQLPVKVVELDDKEATIDMNHPLAGKKLNFKITLKEIVA